jgi:hypothetical protein
MEGAEHRIGRKVHFAPLMFRGRPLTLSDQPMRNRCEAGGVCFNPEIFVRTRPDRFAIDPPLKGRESLAIGDTPGR